MSALPDVQENDAPIVVFPINLVGVDNIKLPFTLLLRDAYYDKHEIDLVANTSISTNLVANVKGISMSRLLEAIRPYLHKGLNWEILKNCLDAVCNSIGQNEAKIKMSFDLPMIKKSPLSKNKYPLFHSCYFEGYKKENNYKFHQFVKVQYSSYCPCSAALSKELDTQGFPHAQRSFAHILVDMDLKNKKQIWLEDIIDLVLNNIKTQPYPIIKRVDEQEIAKIASENPLFVEDAIRILSKKLSELDGIIDWCVRCVHEESIHCHDAIAVNWKYVENGFDFHSIEP